MTEAAGTAGTAEGANAKNIREIHRGSLVRFYEIDLSKAGHSVVLRFHPGLNEFGGPVVWGGPKRRREYLPFPIAIEGMEYDGQGRQPRPTLTVSNLEGPLGPVDAADVWRWSPVKPRPQMDPQLRGMMYGSLGALVRALGDLNGCTLTHRMTLARFLDAENFVDGNESADPALEFPKDVYIFERKAEETPEYIKFELASALDLEGQLLPKRSYNANYCPHRYRGPLCGYTGAGCFDEGDAGLEGADARERDRCGKRLRSCELRFCQRDGETEAAALARGADGRLPFGGFPGVGLLARH
jgi:lambda family phage minor tail protein L